MRGPPLALAAGRRAVPARRPQHPQHPQQHPPPPPPPPPPPLITSVALLSLALLALAAAAWAAVAFTVGPAAPARTTTTTTTTPAADPRWLHPEQQTTVELQTALRARLDEFRAWHVRAGRPHAVGMRGVSWVHRATGGALLAAPRLAHAVRTRRAIGGRVDVDIIDVSDSASCDASVANKVDVWVRLAGPQIIAKVAEPVAGLCRWRASFEVNVAGEYTAFARVLHFNGAREHLGTCSSPPDDKAAKRTRVDVVMVAPLHPFESDRDDCCNACVRIPECAMSAPASGTKHNTTSFVTGRTRCVLLRRSTSSKSPTLEEVARKWQFSTRDVRLIPASRDKWWEADELDTMWQLGCGRDRWMMTAMPCAAARGPSGSVLLGAEDIVLFEHEYAGLRIDPALDGTPAWTLREAHLDYTTHRSSKGAVKEQAQEDDRRRRPICEWPAIGGGTLANFSRGFWVQTPSSVVDETCGPYPTPAFQVAFHKDNNIFKHTLAPLYPPGDASALCYTRFSLPELGDASLRLARNNLHVWRSRLSESYADGPGHPIASRVGGLSQPTPWTGHYVLPVSNQSCRLHPHRTANEIRQCFAKKRIDRIEFRGKSMRIFFVHYVQQLLRAAFPNPNEAQLDSWMSFASFNYSAFPVPPRRGGGKGADDEDGGDDDDDDDDDEPRVVYLTNLASPHLILGNLSDAELANVIAATARDSGNYAHVRVFFNAPFTVWERTAYQTYGRTLRLNALMRDAFERHGWYVLDLTSLGAAWVFDATPEGDTVHFVGHTMVELAHLFIDAVCRAPNNNPLKLKLGAHRRKGASRAVLRRRRLQSPHQLVPDLT